MSELDRSIDQFRLEYIGHEVRICGKGVDKHIRVIGVLESDNPKIKFILTSRNGSHFIEWGMRVEKQNNSFLILTPRKTQQS